MHADAPIGVFDSGVGGLTVVKELTQLLPRESILYFGDSARVPYGPKSADTVRRYSREATAYLCAQGVKLVVVACNTATAYAYEALRSELPVPVVGVIEPGARAAIQATRTGRIGVIGTAGTIRSGAYDFAVRELLPDARVYAQACPLFVPIVEEGWSTHQVAELAAREYLQPLHDVDIDVLILGCTHYPLLKPLIAQIMGARVTLVDSAAETASEVQETLAAQHLLTSRTEAGALRFSASDSPLRFREVGRRFLGDIVRDVQHVDVEGFADLDRERRVKQG
ncbi:MAG TPA: glutamate racemase [Longimicrobiales bacterium]|nr:glutamate racemase [Longimicrobiales bacterium]